MIRNPELARRDIEKSQTERCQKDTGQRENYFLGIEIIAIENRPGVTTGRPPFSRPPSPVSDLPPAQDGHLEALSISFLI